MFGCLRRLGCLVILLIAAAAAWYVYSTRTEPDDAGRPVTTRATVWEPVTRDGAERTRLALESLSDARGPGSVQVSAGDLASYIFFSSSNHLPANADDVEAAVLGDRLAVRALVPLRDLGLGRALGPLASMLSDTDTLFFSGNLRVIQPEVGQYRVKELRVARLRIPSGVIPRILRQIDRGDRPAGVPPDALVLPVPGYVGDIRVTEGMVTLTRQAR